MTSLQGRTALVTGASSGIGRAVTLELLKRGVRVAACARSLHRLEELQRDAGEHVSTLHTGTADVSKEAELARFIETATVAMGSMDIVVANAGFGIFSPLTEMKTADFDDVMNTNVRGVFLALKHTVPTMVERRFGDVVIVSSLSGKQGFPTGAAYAASKFAVRGLAQSLMLEVRQFNVRVISVFPGSTDTRFFDGTPMSPKRESILTSSDVADVILGAITAPRRALSSEIDIRPSNPG